LKRKIKKIDRGTALIPRTSASNLVKAFEEHFGKQGVSWCLAINQCWLKTFWIPCQLEMHLLFDPLLEFACTWRTMDQMFRTQ
jgi:hypothetical protein